LACSPSRFPSWVLPPPPVPALPGLALGFLLAPLFSFLSALSRLSWLCPLTHGVLISCSVLDLFWLWTPIPFYCASCCVRVLCSAVRLCPLRRHLITGHRSQCFLPLPLFYEVDLSSWFIASSAPLVRCFECSVGTRFLRVRDSRPARLGL
jgi:hypothetical protein